MADVGARVVHSELRSLRAQALWLGTSAKGDRADTLSRYASSIPVTSMSLFGGRLSSAVTKAASNARTYTAMADSFVQAGLQCPKPPCGSWEGKRRFSGSPPSFRSKNCRSSSNQCSKAFSKKRTSHTKTPHPDNRQPKGPGPCAGPKTQQKDKQGCGRSREGKNPKA